MGAQLVREVATKTNDAAGDGTTTATVLAQAFVNEGMKNVTAGANPMDIKRGMQKAVAAAVDAVKQHSQKVNGSKDSARVGTVSAGDAEIGQLIADAMEKVTADGVITIEENKTTAETYTEVVEGMQFDRGYVTPYMVTDTEKMETVYDDCSVLITDKKISVFRMVPLLEQVIQSKPQAADHCRGCRATRSVQPHHPTVCAAAERCRCQGNVFCNKRARRCCRISPPDWRHGYQQRPGL